MATDALSYTGINRAYSDFAGSRACEELINLRPATEGVVPVKEALVRMSNVPYHRVFIHYTTSGPKYVAIGRNNADVYAKHLVYDEENETWTEAKTLFSISAPNPIAAKDLLERTYYASAGNVLLFSLCDPENSVFENRAFTWKWSDRAFLVDGQYVGGETYVPTVADAPDVSFDVKDDNLEAGATSDIRGVWRSIAHISYDSSVGECTDAVASGINAAQEENPDLCFGTFIIAVAFKTTDGNTFWSGQWRVYDPVPTVRSAPDTPYIDESTRTSSIYDAFFEKYGGFGYEAGGTNGDFLNHIYVYGTKVRLEFDQLAQGSWDPDESIIQSLEVYCSKPQCYLDARSVEPGVGLIRIPGAGNLSDYLLCLPQTRYADMDLGGQLLYRQASIPMASLAEADQTVELSFGGNVQMTEDTLEADAGALKRYGRLLSYNARFHYFDSVAKMRIGMPSFQVSDVVTTADVDVFVRYSDPDQTEFVYAGTIEDAGIKTGMTEPRGADVVIAPSLNIKEVVTYFQLAGVYMVRRYRMSPSTSYNFTICTDGCSEDEPSATPNAELEAVKAGSSTIISNGEPDAINVTEQYNPFVFLVQHSYKAPGNVIDVQPQMAGITDASYGRDPLSVFTERGVYALTQGSADVLYGAFLPVSNSVVSRSGGGALPTEMGIFFLADGALWLLAGRRSTLVSDALHMGPHPYIRTCPGYQKISGGGSATPEYDVSNLVSSSSFEVYVRSGGRLGFNRFRMELLISNRSYPYTYVLSLKYRQWFKIGKCVWQDDISGNLLSTPGTNGTISVLDLSTETDGDVLVHMQTRPFSMGYRYIHMHRIVAMVRASLSRTAGEKLVAGLYGSDDLQEWKLLAYAKRPGSASRDPLKVSQLRTTSASRSWRYYTVCVGGVVPTDTDLGPVVVDYEPVIRRIG